MKFLVDKMPMDKEYCYFCIISPNPPCIKEPYSFKCRITNRSCDLGETECRCLMELQNMYEE